MVCKFRTYLTKKLNLFDYCPKALNSNWVKLSHIYISYQLRNQISANKNKLILTAHKNPARNWYIKVGYTKHTNYPPIPVPIAFAKNGQTFCPPRNLGMRSVNPSDTNNAYAVTAGRLPHSHSLFSLPFALPSRPPTPP